MVINSFFNPACARTLLAGLLACLLAFSAPASEIILTAENLNESLKQMQRLRQQMDTEPERKAEYVYQTGILARDLAAVLSEEVALYDSQQGGLIQLALDRTAELGVRIDWVEAKKRFIYDGAAFSDYLKLAPEGEFAANSAYQILETEFVEVSPEDPVALQRAAEHKQDYLSRYPDHEQAAEVALLLAIDYRDLWRLYRSAVDTRNADHYLDLTRNQFNHVRETYADARQAKIATGLLGRLETELQQAENPPAAE